MLARADRYDYDYQQEDGDRATLIRRSHPRASKEYECGNCASKIGKGDHYTYELYRLDDEKNKVFAWRRHGMCPESDIEHELGVRHD